MSTKTLILKKRQERTYDYIYDPIHTTGGERDHAKASFKAHAASDKIIQVPIYRTMFSELRHYPRYRLCINPADPVPTFINKEWRGYADQARDQLVQYTKFNYAPHVKVPPKDFEDPHVSGKNRYRYFERPILPYIQAVHPNILFSTTIQDPFQAKGTERRQVITPATRTLHTQTDYRDSEAQTLPYSPEYILRPGEQPELLTLATLAYKRGLPAGLAEVEMIERARMKRAWENTLPELSDMTQCDKRRRMIDEMERADWQYREREIEKIQEERLKVLKQLLVKRDERNQELDMKRVDRVWTKKEKERERNIRNIRKEHMKVVRKLLKKRRNIENNVVRRDVIGDYSQYESEVFAPLTRHGVFPDRNSERYCVKSRYLSTYDGLLELESSLPKFVTDIRMKVQPPKKITNDGFVKRQYKYEMELDSMHRDLKAQHERIIEPRKPLRFLVRVEKPVPRPPTPSIEIPSNDEEEKELAVTFLQKIIRGRAVQNMMFEGREKRSELIREIRSTHALQIKEQLLKKKKLESVLAVQRQRHCHENKEFLVDDALNKLEGNVLADEYDFLVKELIRLEEERKIHAITMLAERKRRMREAEESGRRQVEERRRREADEIFKQVIKVHQDSVDTYLEDVVLKALDRTAHEQARIEIEQMATKINDIVYEMEETRDELQSEEIVAELVHGFLLPEIQRKDMQERVRARQRKYLLAAHKEIYDNTPDILPDGGENDKNVSGDKSHDESTLRTILEESVTLTSSRGPEKETLDDVSQIFSRDEGSIASEYVTSQKSTKGISSNDLHSHSDAGQLCYSYSKVSKEREDETKPTNKHDEEEDFSKYSSNEESLYSKEISVDREMISITKEGKHETVNRPASRHSDADKSSGRHGSSKRNASVVSSPDKASVSRHGDDARPASRQSEAARRKSRPNEAGSPDSKHSDRMRHASKGSDDGKRVSVDDNEQVGGRIADRETSLGRNDVGTPGIPRENSRTDENIANEETLSSIHKSSTMTSHVKSQISNDKIENLSQMSEKND